MIKKTKTGKSFNRFCDSCGRWLTKSNRTRGWVANGAKPHREDSMYCHVCLPPQQVARMFVYMSSKLLVAPGTALKK